MTYPHEGRTMPHKQLSEMARRQSAGAAAQVAFNKGLPLSVSVERQAAFVSDATSGGTIVNNQLAGRNGDTIGLALGRLKHYIPYAPGATPVNTNVKRDFHAQMQYEIDQWLADVRKGL